MNVKRCCSVSRTTIGHYKFFYLCISRTFTRDLNLCKSSVGIKSRRDRWSVSSEWRIGKLNIGSCSIVSLSTILDGKFIKFTFYNRWYKDCGFDWCRSTNRNTDHISTNCSTVAVTIDSDSRSKVVIFSVGGYDSLVHSATVKANSTSSRCTARGKIVVFDSVSCINEFLVPFKDLSLFVGVFKELTLEFVCVVLSELVEWFFMLNELDLKVVCCQWEPDKVTLLRTFSNLNFFVFKKELSNKVRESLL